MPHNPPSKLRQCVHVLPDGTRCPKLNAATADHLCPMHHRRTRVHGDADYISPKPTTAERFWSKVDKDGPMPDFTDPLVRVTEADGNCWVWTGAKSKNGHGMFTQKKGSSLTRQAHRYSYELAEGEIPTGHHVDHLCRNTACVRVGHLEPVTPYINNARGLSPSAINSRKVVCKNGHEYSSENTYTHLNPTSNMYNRYCRACRADHQRAFRNRKKNAR